MANFKTALVIGAGAFGTSIASVLAENFDKVVVKVRSQDVYDQMKSDHENQIYLPGQALPKNLIPALSWDEVREHTQAKLKSLSLVYLLLPSFLL